MSKSIPRLLLINLILSVTFSYGQFSSKKVISDTAGGAWTVFAGDLDGDGFKDVISANRFDSTITWFKSIDGGINFVDSQLVSNLNSPLDIIGGDIDNDGDLDLIATSPSEDIVVWYENLDAEGNFSSQNIISDTALVANDVKTIDIDGDGDLDVFIASDVSGLSWHRNLDGLGTFSEPNIIISVGGSTRDIFLTDIDGDDLKDIVSTSSGSVNASWYKHLDGDGTFGTANIIHVNDSTMQSALAADIDGDGDQDVITTTFAEDKISWFENLDGLGTFGPQQVISTVANGAITLAVADMDNDGDPDIVCGDAIDSEVTYYENLDGLGNFGDEVILNNTSPSLRSVIASDINNDGFLDIVAASRNDNTVAWYENLIPLKVATFEINKTVTVFPNPVGDELFFTSKFLIKEVNIYSITGQLLKKYNSSLDVSVDVRRLRTGIYIVSFRTDEGIAHKKIIKK